MKEQIIQITAGNGPAECCWAVAKVQKIFLKEAKQFTIDYELIDKQEGPENGTIKSVILKLKGGQIDEFMQQWEGTVQWVGQSQFRKFHKRKNWFIGVFSLSKSVTRNDTNLKEIKFNFVKSGGPGGQHVNKVNTKVIATHLPSGLSVAVSSERSQYRNKLLAIQKLMEKIEQIRSVAYRESIKEQWDNHRDLDRGNPIRVFKGQDFKPNNKPKKYKHRRNKEKQQFLRDINN